MICNQDCFNCPFDDCENDEITDREVQEIESRDQPKRKHGDSRAYYSINREKILKQKKIYYQNNKDKRRGYLERNKEKIKVYKHEYYLAHKEKWRKHA